MTLADKVTSLRLILAPFFFIVYLLPNLSFFSGDYRWTVPILWIIFILSEITDLLDGKIARARNEVSDFGKLFDPFSDVLVRITYFLCFVIEGILPAFLFLAVLYREYGILFIRNLMITKKVVMGARWGGKIKAFTYMIAGAIALISASINRLDIEGTSFAISSTIAVIVFSISVIISIISFIDYLLVYKKTAK